MKQYKVLNQQTFSINEFSIVPIRKEDRYAIMQWRNEQIYHLRQDKPLTKEAQDNYFKEVVAKLFEQEQPKEILFSYLQNDKCIGYGGLVHINWEDKNAEISFVTNIDKEGSQFEYYLEVFLNILKQPAFKNLNLRKICTNAFDLRPLQYEALDKSGFVQEERLKGHRKDEEELKDVLIYTFWNPLHELKFRKVITDDVNILYKWANEKEVRLNSLNSEPLIYADHLKWFTSKLKSTGTEIFIFTCKDIPVGQVRLDLNNELWEIDYSVDRRYRGLGVGSRMISEIVAYSFSKDLKAIVKAENKASQKVFENLDFVKVDKHDLSRQKNLYEYILLR